jgi:hypothetical protein
MSKAHKGPHRYDVRVRKDKTRVGGQDIFATCSKNRCTKELDWADIQRILNAKPAPKYRKVGTVMFHNSNATVCTLMKLDTETQLFVRERIPPRRKK